MKTSDSGINLIKKFEGYRGSAYKCPAGVWTIGWGTTSINGRPVTQDMSCTAEQATEWLKSDLTKFEAKVNKYSKYNWNQNQFDALVSFAYNIGSIDQLTANGTRTLDQIAEKFTAYCKANGKVLEGLRSRRIEEQTLFNSHKGLSVIPKSPLCRGSRGEEVKKLQNILNKIMNFTLNEDGVFGELTEHAVIEWKSLHKNLCGNGHYCASSEETLRGDLK